jgi:hypothetical protein
VFPKSGGPDLSVIGISPRGRVRARMHRRGRLHGGDFLPSSHISPGRRRRRRSALALRGCATVVVIDPTGRRGVWQDGGREEGAFTSAEAGHGSLVCVTGEPGIGKTTFGRRLPERPRGAARACEIARGHCSERLAGTEAYSPVIEADNFQLIALSRRHDRRCGIPQRWRRETCRIDDSTTRPRGPTSVFDGADTLAGLFFFGAAGELQAAIAC